MILFFTFSTSAESCLLELPLGKIGVPTKTTFNHVIFQMDNPNFLTKKFGKFWILQHQFQNSNERKKYFNDANFMTE